MSMNSKELTIPTTVNDYRKATIYEAILAIRDASGRNEKIERLRLAIQHTPVFERYIVATYDPMVRYHIRQIPEYQEGKNFQGLIHMKGVLEKHLPIFSNRKKTGKEAEKYLIATLDGLSYEDQQALILLLERDIKAGISVKSINKAKPGLILEYPCMLCSKCDDKTSQNIVYPAYSQIKMDGLRANIIINSSENAVLTFSRNGKALGLEDTFDFLRDRIKRNVVLDGEVVVKDAKGNIMPRKKSNGIINRFAQNKITEEQASKYTLCMVVWDVITLGDFKAGQAKVSYKTRFEFATKVVETINRNKMPPNVEVQMVDNRIVNSLSEARQHFSEAFSQGEEGTILKNAEAYWEDGRSRDQLKLKMENEADLFIKEIVEGRGRFQGKLGAFLCESADGKVQVSVGSGFSEEQREDYFSENMVGKVVAVKYNEIIEADNRGTKSLFLPIFVEVRDDKSSADSFEDLS